MFTPIHSAIGAYVLHQGSFGLLRHNGRILGVSGLLRDLLGNGLPVIAGMVSSVVPIYLLLPGLIPTYPALELAWRPVLSTMAIAAMVGWGTKNGKGCTSGHMLCGTMRLSARSLIAVAVFFTTAAITANVAGTIPPVGPDEAPAYMPVYPSVANLAAMVSIAMASKVINEYIVPEVMAKSKRNYEKIYSFIAGLQMGLGLWIAGMADATKVHRFFSFSDLRNFDPSLGLIMLFGVGPNILSYYKLMKTHGNEEGKMPPTFTSRFAIPTAGVKDIDWRFVVGSFVFGVAWGLRGVCPGNAVTQSVVTPIWGALWAAGFYAGSFLLP
ncbi:hypothetical protein KEM55_002891 [Ascosphaera atra]|nr:hypothetical protein KEM55_002891 [Ascosphaera atra]